MSYRIWLIRNEKVVGCSEERSLLGKRVGCSEERSLLGNDFSIYFKFDTN